MKWMGSLEEIKEDIWRNLLAAVDKKNTAFRHPVVATISDGIPVQRTVVLRNIFISNRTLLFHTDRRSLKVRDLEANPHLSWLFYDDRSRVQLHIRSVAQIHDAGSELHENEWNSTEAAEQRMYCVTEPPGTPVEDPMEVWPEKFRKPSLTLDDTSMGKANFRVVSAEVDHMDWLQLHPEGEYRAIFEWKDDRWQGNWVCP